MSDSPAPFVSSDPGAWMRTYYAEDRAASRVLQLAPAHQFAALLEAIAADYPAHAAQLRDSNAASRSRTQSSRFVIPMGRRRRHRKGMEGRGE